MAFDTLQLEPLGVLKNLSPQLTYLEVDKVVVTAGLMEFHLVVQFVVSVQTLPAMAAPLVQ